MIYVKEGIITISDNAVCDICGKKPVVEYVGRGGDRVDKFCKEHAKIEYDSKPSTN